MNTVASGGPESLSQRIKTLEGLIHQQKEFIDHTSMVWHGLLETEKARSRQNEDIRISLESRLAEMETDRAHREGELAKLREKLDEDRARQKSMENAAREERERVTTKLAALETDLAEKLDMLKHLTTRLAAEEARSAQLQNEKNEQQQHTAKAEALLDDSRSQVKKLEQDIARAENILRQRQEEIEQTLSLLTAHRDRVSSLERELKEAEEREAVLEAKLGDANGWIFKLAEQRADHQSQLSSLARDRDAKSRELGAAKAQLQRLNNQIDLLTSKNAALSEAVEKAAAQPAPTSSSPAAAPPYQSALMDPVKHRDKSMLMKRLASAGALLPETDAEPAEALTAPALPRMRVEAGSPNGAPQRLGVQAIPARQPMPMVVQTRNLETERLLRETREQMEWLRQLAVFALDKPGKWWWRFMPLRWQRKRQNEKLQQSGLFDGDGYLSRYPDVAAAGIAPLRHYLMHGMLEARER
ncbi:hypothetical protein [Sphingobium lignivorans]|uniref:Septal ring factor EnvC (AmiA/AmiB activator) n=1 Tax=Sphingobium lignivorans TaxID=2735886 RepID=A0ABR6NCN0_9SPHN|nr:hypothetical protein [Sphingobium lignivorans]MBB5985032.1 septal ring factor EnvC (AmiA/AmiB activator) [Sphingobium lignivorans]